MKHTCQNTFQDAMNLDLHPIVTPNSVLTDNLNGTFITYNGNEFCLQNDKGNILKSTLTEGFVPIGIKEHNGVLYIVSYNESTKESEIGTYPGVDWSIGKEIWTRFNEELGYQPLKILIKNPTFYQKDVVAVNSFASIWWKFRPYNEIIDKLDSTFNGFIRKLKEVSNWTDDYIKNTFLNDPMIDRNYSEEVKTFLWNVVTGVECCDTYGRCPIWTSGDTNNLGQQKLRVWSAFLGDNTDFEDFEMFYNELQLVFDYAKTHPGVNNAKLTTYLNKYVFSVRDWYNIFSYDGLVLSYDYPWNGFDLKCNAEELSEMLEIIFSIANQQASSLSLVYYTDQPNKRNVEGITKANTTTVNWEESKFEEFRSKNLGFDLKHPVEIKIQDSYDGSVNLILTDNNNIPYIINTEFSVDGNRYKLIRRAIKDYLFDDLLEDQCSLIKNPVSFAEFQLMDIITGGELKGGNYTFYAKLGDADGNQTDIISESGVVSVFNGTVGNPATIYGTLGDERTDKIIKLRLNNIPSGYSKVYLYYTREYSDTQGYLMEEAAMLEKPFDVLTITNGLNYCDLVITGIENIKTISIEDLNITYHVSDRVKTIAQQQDMLFLGNIGNVTYDFSDFDSFAKKIKTCVTRYYNESLDYLSQTSADYTANGEYYDVQNIYSKVGYWPGEYYRFGIVFILANGQNSPVFNMNGGPVSLETQKSWFGEYNNPDGVFYIPKQDASNKVITNGSIIPWHFKFDCSEMIEEIIGIGKGYENIIKGYFIVRQKRIPEVITQGLQVRLDTTAHVPVLPWRVSDSNGIETTMNVLESFVDEYDKNDSDKSLRLTYSPESVSGSYIKPSGNYFRAVQIKLRGYAKPDFTALGVTNAFLFGIPALIGAIFNFGGVVQERNTPLFMIFRYDPDGNVIGTPVIQEHNNQNYPVIGETEEYWFNYDTYYGGYVDINTKDNVWVRKKTSSGPGGVSESDYYYNNDYNWKRLITDVTSTTTNPIYKEIFDKYKKDKNVTEISNTSSFLKHVIEATPEDEISALLSLEAVLTPNIKNRLNGSSVTYEPIGICSSISTSTDSEDSTYNIVGRHQSITSHEATPSEEEECQAVYVSSNNVGKVIGSHVFSTMIGNATDVTQFCTTFASTSEEELRRNVVRGKFTPYIGLTKPPFRTDGIWLELAQLANRTAPKIAFEVRAQDVSPYYCVSKRCSLLQTSGVDVYRGDCYVITETIRINYNFIDPSYPICENILKPKCWNENYRITEDGEEGSDAKIVTKWDEINVTDVNTVSLGHWITFKCLASSNISLRAEDPFDVTSVGLLGNPRSFYPLSASTSTAGKQLDSELFSMGYGVSVGQVRHQQYIKTPYVKQEYENRVMFSNKCVTDEFVNGYRVFQGLSYQDYDKQYGPIVKLEPWGNNLICVFEHGIALLPVNEKALMQTTTEQTIHIYGHGVLPEQMSIISQDYGSKYANSVIRTPIGIYGIDTDAKKIWRFSDKQGFETLSDMKIESYLNKYLFTDKDVKIGLCDVRAHYNSLKGDVMFTFYGRDEEIKDEVSEKIYFGINTKSRSIKVGETIQIPFTTNLPKENINLVYGDCINCYLDNFLNITGLTVGNTEVSINGNIIKVTVSENVINDEPEQEYEKPITQKYPYWEKVVDAINIYMKVGQTFDLNQIFKAEGVDPNEYSKITTNQGSCFAIKGYIITAVKKGYGRVVFRKIENGVSVSYGGYSVECIENE